MNLLETGEMITEQDICKWEIKMNFKLPEEYKIFLLENNGGIPEYEVEFSFVEIDLTTKEQYEQGTDIHYFYSIDEIIEIYQNLISEKLIHKNYIPIACDSFGNEILLSLEPNKDNGCVFFANHEMLNLNDSFWITSKITDSFNEFIDKLKQIEL